MAFYLPRVIWVKAEEGKLSKLLEMVKFTSLTKTDKKGKLVNLKEGEVAATKRRNEMKTAASNIAGYLNLNGAGHKMYGIVYLTCQVIFYMHSYSFHISDVLLANSFCILS